ncbi:MAG: GNAT family N-acetyltransferase [Bacteroidetes bacterium]|nr:GNAT family N-acetyltransferase [Bacteroidota bacterium]
MNILLNEAQQSDIPFLRKMLYEAVFWRAGADRPSFEEGLAYPDVRNALADWGERDGDAAVVAAVNSIPVGAAWYRFWTDSNNTRGYVEANIPVLAIGVHSDYRHQGIGKKMIDWLIEYASTHAIQKISLCVSKDNYAQHLYRQQDFLEYADIGNSFLMVRNIKTSVVPGT